MSCSSTLVPVLTRDSSGGPVGLGPPAPPPRENPESGLGEAKQAGFAKSRLGGWGVKRGSNLPSYPQLGFPLEPYFFLKP